VSTKNDPDNENEHPVNDDEDVGHDHIREIKRKEKSHNIKAVNALAESLALSDLSSEKVELSALKFLLTTGCRTTHAPADSSTTNGNTHGDCAPQGTMLRGTHLLQAIRVCYRVYLKTYSEPNKTTARAALRQIVSSVFARLEVHGSKLMISSSLETNVSQQNSAAFASDDPFETPGKKPKEDGDGSVHTTDNNAFPSSDHRDAYLVLRSLCKLSMKAINDAGAETELTSSRAKGSHIVFSRNDKPANPAGGDDGSKTINAGPQLIYAVRNYLCHSLLKNCTSDNTTVVNLSLRLFVPLIRHFRSHLKTEIEAFVTNVFFVILDSKNSTVEHKLRVVVLFEEICGDPETLAEIFLNYDCDLSAVDLFQRIVNTLAKVAKIDLHDHGIKNL
jgi:brefeldin A-inhibited guanine nucleotide-exchange protein